MRWRLLLTQPFDGPDNMALDEALLARARVHGEYVLRVYAWQPATLSLGRNQRARDVFDRPSSAAQTLPVVRRLTGGRAVLHHREVTYSVSGPASPDDSLRATYIMINGILLGALHRLGVRAGIAMASERGRFPPPASAPCFELPAPGEIVLGDRKLVGSAQLRENDAFLQHGSILIDDDQGRVAGLTDVPLPAVAPAATLREAMGREPALDEVAQALFDEVRARLDTQSSMLELDDVLAAAMRSARQRYVSDLWTWRR
ncbi:MAG: lipoate--protein ligase family protein [Gemmatimonadota bacterium]